MRASVPSNMTWVEATRTLTYFRVGACEVGQTYYVRFRVTTANGGTDALIAKIVPPQPASGGAGPSARSNAREDAPAVPALPPGAFAVTAPDLAGVPARLGVFDLAGRRVATVHGRGGELLIWEGRDRAGLPVPTGVYLYRLEAGTRHKEGKFVVVR